MNLSETISFIYVHEYGPEIISTICLPEFFKINGISVKMSS